RVALQCLAHLGLLENIDVLELRAHGAQRRDGLRGEAALGEVGRALHEEYDRRRAQLGFDSLDNVHSFKTSVRLNLWNRAAVPVTQSVATAVQGSWKAILQSRRPCASTLCSIPGRPARKF